MTTFDEEKLRHALQEAADGFAVSEGARESILSEARESADTDGSSRIRRLVERTGRVRSTVLAVAASVVVLAVAIPLFNTEVPTVNAVAAKSTPGLPGGTRSEALLPASENRVINGTGLSVTTPSKGVRGSVVNTNGHVSVSAGAEQPGYSLRVEEVGTIRLTVGANKFQSTLSKLADFATTEGGFVASTQSHSGTNANHSFSTGVIVLQVPEHNFTLLVNEVRHSGVATSVVTSANDVTGQYVDLQARIGALKVSRTQYLRIMTRTNSIDGILAVQRQLDSIQSQIEQLQAQLNLLNSETTYATLTVSLSQAGHVVNPLKHSANGIDKAWHESLHGFAAGFEWLIRIAGPLLFALLLLAALVALGRVLWRATQRRRSRVN